MLTVGTFIIYYAVYPATFYTRAQQVATLVKLYFSMYKKKSATACCALTCNLL